MRDTNGRVTKDDAHDVTETRLDPKDFRAGTRRPGAGWVRIGPRFLEYRRQGLVALVAPRDEARDRWDA